MHEPSTSNAEAFALEVFGKQKYLAVRGFFSGEMLRFLHAYYDILLGHSRFYRGDDQCPSSLSLYGDPALDALLESYRSTIGRLVGVDLVPTYSYSRVYAKGDVLERHTDRPSCEVSATVTIRIPEGGGPSVIYMRPPGQEATRLEMWEGDACIYAGCDVEHWRDPIPRGGYMQLFLHFITYGGVNFPAHAYDGRPRLGSY